MKRLIQLVGIFLGIVMAGLLHAVPAQQSTPATKLAFEAATIKPPTDTSGPRIIACHAVEGGTQEIPLGRCVVTRRTLVEIMAWAFNVQAPKIIGGPNWVNSDM